MWVQDLLCLACCPSSVSRDAARGVGLEVGEDSDSVLLRGGEVSTTPGCEAAERMSAGRSTFEPE